MDAASAWIRLGNATRRQPGMTLLPGSAARAEQVAGFGKRVSVLWLSLCRARRPAAAFRDDFRQNAERDLFRLPGADV